MWKALTTCTFSPLPTIIYVFTTRTTHSTVTLRSGSSNAIAALFLDFLTFSRSFFVQNIFGSETFELHVIYIRITCQIASQEVIKLKPKPRKWFGMCLCSTYHTILYHPIAFLHGNWYDIARYWKEKAKTPDSLESTLSVLCNEMLWKWRWIAYLVRLFLLGKGYSKSFLFLAIR